MSAIIKDFLDRLGPLGPYIAFTLVIGIAMWSMGLINAPATANDVRAMQVRVGGIELSVSDLRSNSTRVRDDLEKIRIAQAVQSEKIDRVLDLLNKR